MVLLKRYYIYVLVLLSQFFFFPLFLNYNSTAKFFLIALSLSIFILFISFSGMKCRLPLAPVVFSSFLLMLSIVNAYHLPTSLASGGVLILLLIFGLYVVPNVFPRGLTLAFYPTFLVFIQLVSALGLYQYFSYIAIGKTYVPLIPYLLPPNNGPRVSGIYGQPNLFALLLIIGIIVFIYMHLHGERVFKVHSSVLKQAYYLPMIMTCFTFFLTGSRAGIIALLISLIFALKYFYNKGFLSNQSKFRPKLIKIILSLSAAYFLYYFVDMYVAVLPGRSFTDVGMSADARFIFWVSAFLIFLDHPWLGVGLDNFKFYLPKYTNAAHDLLGFVEYEAMGYTKWAHNEFLQLLCETGLAGFFLYGPLLIYLFLFWRIIRKKEGVSLRQFFAYLLLVPFVIQSMFSWPLRHPSLLILFFLLIGSLLALHPGRAGELSRWGVVAIRSLALVCLLGIVWTGYSEVQMGKLFRNYSKENLQKSLPEFENLINNKYLEHSLLMEATPSYVRTATRDKDVEFGKEIQPYVQRLADMHGAHWQWFNLGLLSLLLDSRDEAKVAVNKAIFLRPMEQKYWSFLHYLNMLDASEKTGRPLEEFLPIPPGGTTDDLKGFFSFDERIEKGKMYVPK